MADHRWLRRVALGAGLFAAVAGCSSHHAEKHEENEVQMKFSEVPAAVQKTLTEQAMGVKIDTVDKEMDKGKTVYEADATIGGKEYEIRVAEDGKLISKKEEKPEKGEKD
jgi:hypothetical protein